MATRYQHLVENYAIHHRHLLDFLKNSRLSALFRSSIHGRSALKKNNNSACAGKPSGNFLVTGTNVKAQLGPSVGTRRTPRLMVSQSIYT